MKVMVAVKRVLDHDVKPRLFDLVPDIVASV
jgi:hypothetical protein